jgi:hypothetical protein
VLIPVVITAVVLGLIAPFTLSLAWRVPFGLLPTRTVLRSSLVTSLGTFLIGAIVEGCAAATGPTEGILGAVVGGTFMATLTWLRARRSHVARGTILLAMRLGDETTRDRAREALDQNLRRMRPEANGTWGGHAELVLVVVAAASQAGLFDYGISLLEALPLSSLDDRRRVLVAQALATCRVRSGDVAGARDAISGIERPVAEAHVERWVATLEALLDALTGSPESALAAVAAGGDEDAADASLAASRHLVRAHAFAARGEEHDARAELSALRNLLGDSGLSQALVPEGPASHLAREMADSGEAPG